MTQTEELFRQFLDRYNTEIKDYCHVAIEETELYGPFSRYSFTLTHFDDLYDTLMYSTLIRKTIELHESPEAIVDLGAGSSVPSLLALKESSRENLRTLAVDVDPSAQEVGEHNAEALGLRDRYEFVSSRMEDVLKGLQSKNVIVTSNPPYIPAPESIQDFHFVPINGGTDGTRYMIPLLQHEYPKGSLVAFLWGSLTNPSRILPLIEERFDVVHVTAMKIHLGKYTSHPEIYAHLCNLRREDKVVFTDDGNQIVIGTILRAK